MSMLLSTVSYAQQVGNFPPPERPPAVEATRTTEKISIDGQLDEAAWQKASVVEEFFRMEPRQGGQYDYPTRVRLLFDDKNLYVGAFCYDSLGKAGRRVQDLRRDFEYGENDIFGVQLDPQNLKQYCVSFQTTPYGNQRDLQNFNDTNTDSDWNALWSVRTHPTDSGYFAEFAIPFKSIRYERPAVGDRRSGGRRPGYLGADLLSAGASGIRADGVSGYSSIVLSLPDDLRGAAERTGASRTQCQRADRTLPLVSVR